MTPGSALNLETLWFRANEHPFPQTESAERELDANGGYTVLCARGGMQANRKGHADEQGHTCDRWKVYLDR